MNDEIEEVGIDGDGRIYVRPRTAEFPYIYREAMEVHRDGARCRPHGALPRQWCHAEWLEQILKAAAEQGCSLKFTSKTTWINRPAHLQWQRRHAAKKRIG